MTECKTVDFFLGANSPGGFVSFFDAFDEPKDGFRRYLIKGGPGTGKSGLMKKCAAAINAAAINAAAITAAAMENIQNGLIERIHCSSDVDSLDGVIWDVGKCAIFDATPPHTVEPKYPGAYDRMVSITECWDNEKLIPHTEEIVRVSREISAYHKRCRNDMDAMRMVLGENAAMLSGYWMTDKLNQSANRFAKRLLHGLSGAGKPPVKRMLTALTNRGIVTFENTVSSMAQRVVCVKDPFGAVSDAYLTEVAGQGLKQGLSMITCMSAFYPEKIEHILFPECGIAVLSENRYQKFESISPKQLIRGVRFLPPKALGEMRGILRYRDKIADMLLADAVSALQEAKKLHDTLEGYYTQAVDFKKVNRLSNQVIAEMLKRA